MASTLCPTAVLVYLPRVPKKSWRHHGQRVFRHHLSKSDPSCTHGPWHSHCAKPVVGAVLRLRALLLPQCRTSVSLMSFWNARGAKELAQLCR
jgi:hypothetical protein